MVNVGAGSIDWKRIFAASDVAGIKHYIVEYDNPKSPIDDLTSSYNYLRKLSSEAEGSWLSALGFRKGMLRRKTVFLKPEAVSFFWVPLRRPPKTRKYYECPKA